MLTLLCACRVIPEGTILHDSGSDAWEGTTVLGAGDTSEPDADDTDDSAAPKPAYASCQELLEAGVTDSGVQAITTSAGEIDVWCDQETDGGGWTLAFLKSSPESSSYAGFCADWKNTEAIAREPSETSTSSDQVVGWLDLNAMSYEGFVLEAWFDGKSTYRSDVVARGSLRLAFGQDGYLLWETDEGYTWCGGSAGFVDDGKGQVDQPKGAPDDCKGHSQIGSGWDFSTETTNNAGLVLSGGDGYAKMRDPSDGLWVTYGTPGGAYAIWVR